MNPEPYAVILFFTSNHAFRAEKILIDRGIACRLVPVPRHLSSECGVCLRIERAQREAVMPILTDAQVEVGAVHDT